MSLKKFKIKSISGVMKEQEHLNFEDTVNQGSYYTPPEFVDLVYKFISKNVQDWEKYTILDTSCGYGNFLRENSIGADIDKKAIEVAKKHTKNCKFFLYFPLICTRFVSNELKYLRKHLHP